MTLWRADRITVTSALLSQKTTLMGFCDTESWKDPDSSSLLWPTKARRESCKDCWGLLHEAASAAGPLGRPGESIRGHSRHAKFESSCDLGFILQKKWNSKDGPIPWRRGGVRKPMCFKVRSSTFLVLKIKSGGAGEMAQWSST